MRWLICVILVLAGCLAEPPGPPDSPTPDPIVAEAELAYDCVFGDHVLPSGVCHQRLVDPLQAYDEPAMAIHPIKSNTLAILAHLAERVPEPGVSSGALGFRMELLVSEDAGVSWRRALLPAVHQPGPSGPVALPSAGDPSIAFDAEGVLHVLGMSTSLYRASGFQIFHVSTPDLGRTWSAVSFLATDADNDREWLAAPMPGLLVGVWQNMIATGWTVEAAWSLDGGATWNNQRPADTIPMCSHAAPPILHLGRVLLACAHYEGQDDALGIAIHELDWANGTAPRVSLVEEAKGWWPRLLPGPNGSLVLIVDTAINHAIGSTTLLFHSPDGESWSAPIDVADMMITGSGWDSRRHYATGIDDMGFLHLVMVGSLQSATTPTFTLEKSHLILDATLTVVSDKSLAPSSAPPDTVPIGSSDDWGEVVAAGDATYIVWGRDYGLDLAKLTAIA